MRRQRLPCLTALGPKLIFGPEWLIPNERTNSGLVFHGLHDRKRLIELLLVDVSSPLLL